MPQDHRRAVLGAPQRVELVVVALAHAQEPVARVEEVAGDALLLHILASDATAAIASS